ncbi:uncharacterized protein LOC132201790 [Neocloeon triangulifer]|uniref:uncharacterized protein LOC132201790 n=1 Tax=Neocloeon triangulifer TaxID=2078957 RepID=UPI00286EF2B5|nr:uncharacterized protein LOC132201790 [Neocloeon triangulifer]
MAAVGYAPSSFVLVIEVFLVVNMITGAILNVALIRLNPKNHRRLIQAWGVCNLLALLKTPLLVATMHGGHWPAGDFLCRTYMSVAILQQWTSPWLTAFASLMLILRSRPLHKVAVGLCTILLALPMVLVFCTTAHLETEDSSRCFLPLGTQDIVWTTLALFLSSFFTPAATAACLLIVATHKPQINGRRCVAGLVLTLIIFFTPHWVTQLDLMELKPVMPINAFLFAALILDFHSGIAVPLIFFQFGRTKLFSEKNLRQLEID